MNAGIGTGPAPRESTHPDFPDVLNYFGRGRAADGADGRIPQRNDGDFRAVEAL